MKCPFILWFNVDIAFDEEYMKCIPDYTSQERKRIYEVTPEINADPNVTIRQLTLTLKETLRDILQPMFRSKGQFFLCSHGGHFTLSLLFVILNRV